MATIVGSGDFLNYSAPYSSIFRLVKASTSGTFSTSYINVTWFGSNLSYSTNYSLPISGTVTSISVTDSLSKPIWSAAGSVSMSVDLALDPTLVLLRMISDPSPDYYGGSNGNDTFYFLGDKDTIEAGAGNDILELSRNFSLYSFLDIDSRTSTLTIRSETLGYTAKVNGVETFKFADSVKTFNQIASQYTKGAADKDLVYVFKSEKTGVGVNPASYSYFYTVDANEANYIKGQASWPWIQKTATFEAAHSNPSSSVPVFRFWSDKHQSHFFTINSAEKDQIINWSKTGTNGYDWKFEGEGFRVYADGTTTDGLGKSAIPVYRLWMDDKDFNAANGLSGGHFFTADKGEYDSMIKLVGVKGEGIAFYGEPPGG
jgi:hypothetical protein